MTEHDTTALRQELEEFRAEKEKIRAIVGEIGGSAAARRDKVINVAFIIIILLLLGMDSLRHLYPDKLSLLPPLFSIELGVLAVSVKIIWMIHKQAKVEHFQFWILNSIEFRLNEVSKKIRSIEEKLGEKDD